VTNVGEGLFRLIAVANYGEGSPIDRPKDDLPGTLEIDDPYFRAWRLTVQPGQASPWFRSAQPLVGVQVSAGEIEVQRRSGEPSVLEASGDWFFGDPGQSTGFAALVNIRWSWSSSRRGERHG
jgi:hypothetical protein